MITYQYEPFAVPVFRQSHGPYTLTPFIFWSKDECGLGLNLDDAPKTVWGHMFPRNLIAAWRGIELLRQLSVIEQEDLAYACYAGSRHLYPEQELGVRYLTAKIEPIIYGEIMARPIPQNITDAILRSQGAEFELDLSAITAEVFAGTITWEKKFSIAGVPYPHG